MKYISKTFICLGLFLMVSILSIRVSSALSLSASAGQNTVSVGDTISVTFRASDDAMRWIYNVSYSDNLTLVSGSTSVSGSDAYGDSRSNTLIFRANAAGDATVSASKEYGLVSTDFSEENANASTSFKIVAASAPSDGYHHEEYTNNDNDTDSSSDKDKETDKSSNSALASLSVDQGKLTPSFDPEITEYKLSLPVKTEKVTLTATPSDSTAKVTGAGEIAVKPGENKISIVVTAENGDSTTYTVNAVVAQMPTVFLTYNDKKLGVVNEVEDVTAPAGFTATTVSYQGNNIPAWVNDKKTVTLLYLMDDQNNSTFYAYTPEDGVIGPYLPLEIDGKTYTYTGVPEKQRHIPGLVFGTVEAFGQTLDGFRYEDEALGEFCVLYLMDSDGNYGYYTYDSQNQTLQRFSGAVYTSQDTGLTVPWLYAYIAGGVAAAMLLTIIILAAVSAKRKKKLKAVSAAPAAEAPAEAEEAPKFTTKEVSAPAVSNEAAAPVETPAKVETAPVEVPVETVPAVEAPVETPTEAKMPMPEAAADESIDRLSLDELLNDIRNM